MAISDRNVSTATQAGATPLVVTKPSGVVSGDVLVASFIAVGTVHTTLAGWTEIGFKAEGTSAGLTILRKVAGGSEPASYSFVNSGGLVSGDIIALTGVDNTTPEDATATTGTGTGTTLTAPAITTVTDNAWWMTFFATDGTQTTLSQPSGFTVDVASFSDGAGDVQRVDHKVITPAGPTGTTTSTAASGGWMAISVAVRPAASAAVAATYAVTGYGSN